MNQMKAHTAFQVEVSYQTAIVACELEKCIVDVCTKYSFIIAVYCYTKSESYLASQNDAYVLIF